jgi:hypothetical protein
MGKVKTIPTCKFINFCFEIGCNYFTVQKTIKMPRYRHAYANFIFFVENNKIII